MILGTEPDIEVVGEAADGEHAVAAAGGLHPDIILMDIRMPVLDGIEATRRIAAQRGPRVLIVTTFGDDEYVSSAARRRQRRPAQEHPRRATGRGHSSSRPR